MGLAVSAVLVALELALPDLAAHRPALWLCMRTTAGPEGALAGRGGRVFRAQPEIVLAVRPVGPLELFVGAGVGPAYLVRSPGGGLQPSASGVIGLRVPVQGALLLTFLTRAEVVAGGGAAITLDLRVGFGRRR